MENHGGEREHPMSRGHDGRLVLRSSPSRDESLLNFCERISYENGYESPFWLLGKSSGSIDEFFEDENIKRVAYISGCSYEDLSMRRYRIRIGDGYGVRFFGKVVRAEHINYQSLKICTMCLMEKLSFCAAWDLSLWIACPVHQISLIERCPKCKKKFICFRKEIYRCFCGFDLRCHRGRAAEMSEVYCAQHLASLIGWHTGEFVRPQLSSATMKLELDNFMYLVTALMRFPVHCSPRRNGTGVVFVPLLRSYNLGIWFVAPILFGWPTVFYAHVLDINDMIIQRGGGSQFFLSIAFMTKMRELSILVDGNDSGWRREFPTYMSGMWLKELEERCARND